jgi:hypothetical protein
MNLNRKQIPVAAGVLVALVLATLGGGCSKKDDDPGSPSEMLPVPTNEAASRTSTEVAARDNRPKEEDDIREVVFRSLLSKDRVSFLEVLGGDPPEDFVKRFADHKAPVRKASDAKISKTGRGHEDKNTGEPGWIHRLGAIRWTLSNEAEVEFSFDEGPRTTGHGTFTVKKANGKWIVAKRNLAGA